MLGNAGPAATGQLTTTSGATRASPIAARAGVIEPMTSSRGGARVRWRTAVTAHASLAGQGAEHDPSRDPGRLSGLTRCMAVWASLPAGTEVVSVNDHLKKPAAVAAELIGANPAL